MKNSVDSFKKLRDVGEESKDPKVLIIAYHHLGIYHLNMKDYTNALKCFKFMLKNAMI